MNKKLFRNTHCEMIDLEGKGIGSNGTGITDPGHTVVGTRARKVFAYRACRVYEAPGVKARAFLGVGGAAVSTMAAKGKLLA